MKTSLRSLVLYLAIPSLMLAVYAPLPEQDQGKALTFRLGASVYHDSNIFGGATGAVSSMVYNFAPGVSFNSSVTDQTFVSLGYDLSADHVVDRPGTKNLVSHSFSSRVAHSFTKATTIDVSENYQISRTPASLLNGLPLSADQSSKNNQFSVQFATSAGEKGGMVFKYRNMDTAYDNAVLADGLDRNEHLAGLELSYALLPETKLVGEYRYGQINYVKAGATKDKRSNYIMTGVNYNPSEKTTVTARVGAESRTRKAQKDATAPYAEFNINYAYAEGSHISGVYMYTLEEASDTANFTDTKVNRFILTVQHHLSPLVVASGSLTHESSELQARPDAPTPTKNIAESATRFGLALTWQPTKNWNVSATYDLDHTVSDNRVRNQDRTRFGVGAKFSF